MQKLLHRKYGRIEKLKVRLGKVLRKESPEYTGRELQAAVLYGPRNLIVESIREEVVQPHQIRVDVHYCGLTGSDALTWAGDHYKIPEEPVVLGFEVAGTILEMGRVAYEKTGYQRGEEVVVHNYPRYGGFAENCLADYRDVFRLSRRASTENAAAVVEDYFASLLALGRRARVQKGEYFLVNMIRSRIALAVVDVATRIFSARPIVVCNDRTRGELSCELGAVAILQRDEECLQERCAEITGRKEVRLIVETEGGSNFQNLLKCLQHEGIIAFLGCARDRRQPNFSFVSDCTAFAVSAEHYKAADNLVYRETVEHLLDYRSQCVINPRISAIFGLNQIKKAFDYYVHIPSGKVLIDLKNHDRLPSNYK